MKYYDPHFVISQNQWIKIQRHWEEYYNLDIYKSQQEGNEDMEKKFAVLAKGNFKHKTYEDAEKEAKRYTANNGDEYVIAQAIASTIQPVPEIEVVKL